MKQIILVVHNIRSCHNVGSLLRTAEGMGVSKVWLTGYTPYPIIKNDSRLPHIAEKLTKQINKTALGAENLITWEQSPDLAEVTCSLRSDGFVIAGLEQTPEAIYLPAYIAPPNLAIIVGSEVEGMDKETLALCDQHLEIPMLGQKESFNVVQAAAMTLYHVRF